LDFLRGGSDSLSGVISFRLDPAAAGVSDAVRDGFSMAPSQ
jgi:hypothetical protein